MKHALLPNAAAEASVVSLRHKYVLIVNSKTAGSTLKAVAADLEGEPLARRRTIGRDERSQRSENWLRTPTLTDLPADLLRRVLLSDEFFRFTTVRHPYVRCWSAWTDKILARHPEFSQNYGRTLWYRAACEASSVDDVVSAFEQFVDALATDRGLLGADRHWAPQTLLLLTDTFPYDFIGRTERFPDVVDAWSRATSCDVSAAVERVGRRNSRGLPVPADLLSSRCVEQLARIYRADIDRFEYEAMVPRRAMTETQFRDSLTTFLATSRVDPYRSQRYLLNVVWRPARQRVARLARVSAAYRYNV